MSSSLLAWIWDNQRRLSTYCDTLDQRIERWRAAVIIFTIVAAASATASSQLASKNAMLGVALGVLAAALVCLGPVGVKLSKSYSKHVLRVRAAAEAIESEFFLFLMRVSPYDADDSEYRLQNQAMFCLDTITDLIRNDLYTKVELEIYEHESPPPVSNIDSYVRYRLTPLIDEMQIKKTREAQRGITFARRATLCQIALAAAAAILGGLAIVSGFSDISAWIAVAATAAAAVVAFFAESGYERQFHHYTAVLRELERLRSRYEGREITDPRSITEFVKTCEQVVAIHMEVLLAQDPRLFSDDPT
jgi:conflict system pore-forming effector with SLATT domain/uncharacterized protein DUF4231